MRPDAPKTMDLILGWAQTYSIASRGGIAPDANTDMAIGLKLRVAITSSYFFMVSSALYNIFDPETQGVIKRVHDTGCDIGLHFNYPAYSSKYEHECITEGLLLERVVPVTAMSVHQPDEEVVNWKKLPWPNSCERRFVNGDFKYFSDASHQWRWGMPIESKAFEQGENLHILIHPVWWDEINDTPVRRLEQVAERTKQKALRYLRMDCRNVWDQAK